MGQQWPATWAGALGAADLSITEALLEEVTINLIVEPPELTGLGKQTLGGHKQNFVHTRTQEKGAVTPQETDPEEPEITLPTSVGSSKKQESSRKTSTSDLLTMPKPLTVWITTNWQILKEMGIPDHMTCLPRNMYGQEVTVRTRHGTND